MSGKTKALRLVSTKAATLDLGLVVAELRHSRDVAHNIRLGGKVTEVPSATLIADVLDGIVTSLFPTHLGPHGLNHDSVDLFVSNTLSTSFVRLTGQVARGLQFDANGLPAHDARRRAEEIIQLFARQPCAAGQRSQGRAAPRRIGGKPCRGPDLLSQFTRHHPPPPRPRAA